MSRTRAQEIAAFTWLTPAKVAVRLECKDEHVRDLIHAGKFPDVDGEPGVIDIGSGSMPLYRINPKSVDAFIMKSKVAAKVSAA